MMRKLTLGLLLGLLLYLPTPARAQYLQSFAKFYTGTTVPTVCQRPSLFVSATSGVVYTCQGGVYVPLGVGGGGVITPSQLPSFVTGTGGTDFNIQFDVSSVAFNLPTAQCTIRGAIDGTPQVFCGNKTFSGNTLMDGDLYVTGLFSTDHPIEITGEACGTSEANVGLFGFDPVTGLPCWSFDGSAPGPFPYPRLDQVLDPTANKTFAMGGFDVNFSNGGVVGGTVFNAATGFQVAGAATLANVLRGNGTNFVSAQLASADLSDAANIALLNTAQTFSALKTFNPGTTEANSVFIDGPVASTGTSRDSHYQIFRARTDAGGVPHTSDFRIFNDGTNVAGRSVLTFDRSLDGGAYSTFLTLNVGATANTVSSPLPITSDVGFRVANTATSGNVLRGTGTTFVDATLAAADLSNGVTGTGAVALAGSPTFTGTVTSPRYKAVGTALVSGDFAPTGWGGGAAVGTVTGTDQWFKFTVTAGTTPSLNPTVALTYKNGTWTTVPIPVCNFNGGTGAISFTPVSSTATVLTITYVGTPVDTLTYIVACHVGGI